MKTVYCLFSLLFFVNVGFTQTSETTIKNKFLKVIFNKASNSFAFQSFPSGITFATTGNLYLLGNVVVKSNVTDKNMSKGDALEIIGDKGDKIYLFPNIPFVFIQGKIKNDSSDFKVYNLIPLASVRLSLPVLPEKLKSIGTGGLQSLNKSDGSYAWLGIANPENNNGVVFGWITSQRASGVLLTELNGGTTLTPILNVHLFH